ncbi:chemotaxis protein CheB, partial [candidate division KSB1 bacterium]
MQKRETKSKISSRKSSTIAKKRTPKPKSLKTKTSVVKRKTAQVKEKTQNICPVIGIGASAGGLEALEKYFSNMPSNSGMAFILIQHLSSTQKSIMGELISKYTKMKIFQIKDNIKVAPDSIYIAPPNKYVAILNGRLHLMEPTESHGLRLPIDYFFRSLAEDQSEKANCIVLSGTGTDGTIGLKTIKGEGGMAMVQDIESAKYDGMPRSAIKTGLVDYIMPVEKMPRQLIKYVDHSFFKKTEKADILVPKTIDYLGQIFILLRNQTGHDFSHYKKNTICRRIERRMAIHQISDIKNYVKYIQQNNQELGILFKELLIGVTNFFRDPEAFDSLKNKILPTLLNNKPPSYSIRIWVPGCSTGEEALSIAIIFKELMEKTKQNNNIQIFATDIDINAIETARAGIFPNGIAADVSPVRLKRFFIKEDSTYRVKREIREMIVYAAQDVIKDPPFSKLDLVSCRNLLIYFGAEIQKKILPLFHYTLNHDGYLFLGSSETIGQFSNMYTVIDKKWKIFKRKGIVSYGKAHMGFPIATKADEDEMKYSNRIGNKIKDITLRELSDKILLNKYSPSSVIINDKCDILHFHGKTGKYLEPAPGEARLSILEMAREGLKLQLNTAIRKAIKRKKEIICKDVRVQNNGGYNIINVKVIPILEPASFKGMMIVVFEEVISQKEEKSATAKHRKLTITDERITQLEYELRSTKEYLQTTIEELETSNEELKSTNEELQSSNEELQSTNEELETSKEELQSVNEELVTINAELENKIGELTKSNNDMNNLLTSTEIATIFLDTNLNIVRFTPKTGKIINLI